nr:XRE family transcriptional regulator [Streptomyces sp. TLI_235]
MTAERDARGWSQTDAIGALRAHSPKTLPEDPTMLRQWKRWESGEVVPSEFYQPLIAATFGTVTHALFPVAGRRDGNAEIVAASGMETLEIVSRLQASDVDNATMEALRITTDRLCSEYALLPSAQLALEGRQWLKRVVGLQGQRLTLAQHREVLAMSGWLALLVGCVEYDMGDKRAAESTRRAALSLGAEAEHAGIAGWAHEMRAWFALTTGDYRGVIAASKAGAEVAAHQGVAVQLAAQEAKAWARLGDRRQAEVALDRGRRLLEGMPYPENLDNHFVVDPAKYDFYAMDCYRMLGENKLATALAEEVIRASTDYDGTERSPMRIAEARLTLGVVAARDGDLESALNYGEWALRGERQSLPSLLAVSRELASVVSEEYGGEPGTQAYLDHLTALSGGRRP